MTTATVSAWTIVADDLTGAADAAASYGGTHSSAVVLDIEAAWPDTEILAVNTESRYLPEDEAAAAVAYTVRRALGLGNRVFKKFDSLLRGNVGVEIAAALAEVDPLGHGLALVAPAFPATGRTTLDGVVLVEGVAHTSGPFAGDVAAALALGGLAVGHAAAPNGQVPAEVARRFRAMHQRGINAVVVDAACDADLETIVRAADLVGVPTLLAGSGGLASHITPHRTTGGPTRIAHPEGSRVLVVIGSYSPLAKSQLRALVDAGLRHVMLDHADLGAARVGAELATAIADGDVVLTPDPAAELNKGHAHLVARSLAAATVAVIDECEAVVLTGGETARAVMDALGLTHMAVLGEIEPGVVVNKLPANKPLLITKAGAFGDTGTLVRAIESLRETTTGNESEIMGRPIIAITMGDAAGIGPEIIAKALADAELRTKARMLVIGDLGRMQLAMDIVSSPLVVNKVMDPADAQFADGTIDILDVDCIPADLPWGELSAVAGHGAFLFIEKAVQLAMDHTVDAICTGPLNKAALYAAGHKYPGHTEMLAALTGTKEVSMMLTAPKMRVIHVTTHLGLIDAIAKINGDLVYRTIKRGHDLLIASGIASPRIAVCAINPHAGEGGLFGYGEEAEKIQPGIDQAKAEGIDVIGPLPADTLFFLAGRGDFDLVVAQYHDQGHGPVKVLGLENGVNITVGLPVVRTSVDHGTAFDIAGKNVADHESLLEALRQAVVLAPARNED